MAHSSAGAAPPFGGGSLDRLAELRAWDATASATPPPPPPPTMAAKAAGKQSRWGSSGRSEHAEEYKSAVPLSAPAAAAAAASSANPAAVRPRSDSGSVSGAELSASYPSLAPLSRYAAFHALLHSAEHELAEMKMSAALLPRASARSVIESATRSLEQQSERAQSFLRRARSELQHIATDDALFTQRLAATAAAADGSAAVQIRSNLHAQASRSLAAALQEMRRTLQRVQEQLQRRSERDLQLVAPQLSESEVAALVESGQSADFIRRTLVDDAPSEALLTAVANVQERHLSIMALEQAVRHLSDLFRDLAFLVDQQQNSIDHIALRIAATKDAAEQGEEQIVQAKKWQSKATAVSSHTSRCTAKHQPLARAHEPLGRRFARAVRLQFDYARTAS